MADINRIGTPMDLLDESVVEDPDKVMSGKKFLQKKQQAKSPFLIGSIEEVSRRISQLDQRLQDYRQLVCESRASKDDDAVILYNHARAAEQYQQRERDKKELNQFAGIYTLKSTLLPSTSQRAKKISKISINAKQQDKQQQPAAGNKDDAGKPRLVELHLYPGYDPQEATPLPGGIDPCDIFSKVVQASVHLNKKHQPIFNQLFFCHISQGILKDMFWYLFLEKFQFNKECQQKLFNRTAHNYVSLLMDSCDPIVKDMFMKSFPQLMSQAIYSTFCFSFPDSYRQFGEQFKDDLVYLVYGWMTGIRPPPRSWITWDVSLLEPANLKLREDMINRKSTKTGNRPGRPLTDFDYLGSLTSASASLTASTTTRSVSQSTTKSSAASLFGRSCPQAGMSGVIVEPQNGGSKPVKDISLTYVVPGLDLASSRKFYSPVSSQDNGAIRAVSEAQANPATRRLARNGGGAVAASKSGDIELTQRSNSQIRRKRKPKESHPAGRGCDFVHTVFNLEGKSPLVEHFLKVKGLERDAGLLVWVHRVQLENLPSMEAPTYRDVIADSTKNIRTMKKVFLEKHRENIRSSRVSIKERKDVLQEHIHKQASLLSNEMEVKRLSHLIIMEQRRSSDSVMAGADAAIAAALKAQD